MELLTNSSLRTFRECPKKYKLQYQDGYESAVQPEYFKFGSLWHTGLEAWAKCENPSAKYGVAACAIVSAMDTEADEFMKAKLLILLEFYDQLYRNDPYEVVAAEKEFRAPVLNPETSMASRIFEYGGKLDALYKDGNGRILLIEHKTTSEDIGPESDYWRRLQMDSQISGYYLGAEAMGYQVETCIYDVVHKPMLQPYRATPEENRKYTKDGKLYASQREKDETPEEFGARLKEDIRSRLGFYFARKEVPRSQGDLEDHLMDVWHTGKALHGFRKSRSWPRNVASCITVFGTCPFWKHCSGQASIDDPSLFKKKEQQHAELAPI